MREREDVSYFLAHWSSGHAPFRAIQNNIYANRVQREDVLCTGCDMFVSPTGHLWKPRSQLCVACHMKKNDADAPCHARNFVTLWTIRETWKLIRGLLQNQTTGDQVKGGNGA